MKPSIAHTRDGQPISYNRAPAPDLAPWIARLYVTKVDLGDEVISCGLLTDCAAVRIKLSGTWQAETAGGPRRFSQAVLFFGPQTHRMPVQVRDGFVSLGFMIRPGAFSAFRGQKVAEYLNKISPITELSNRDLSPADIFTDDLSPEEWLLTIEDAIRKRLADRVDAQTHPATACFEAIAMTDPSVSIVEAAERCGVDRRQLERIVRRDFGMSPKQVLRRARALDMASHLRGVADGSEGDEIALRYYDDSHRIREFSQFFGMSPRQFVERPQLLMTLALELRQAGRLEMLKRIEPGKARPWE
ncbi:helix-turn-helix domain-containing protein [Novosphingobium aquimarinum]|uniref:helix-turn-helix domain-containing protein n=1 Tax=Novosphingobium aquimarinum TaxID=2682494 RepID=UPI001E2E1160|nr:AraC family transcriptional regulator [Novosphingobium aquimarinum]